MQQDGAHRPEEKQAECSGVHAGRGLDHDLAAFADPEAPDTGPPEPSLARIRP